MLISCLLCRLHAPQQAGLCAGCRQDLPWQIGTCFRCAIPIPKQNSSHQTGQDGGLLCGECVQGGSDPIHRSIAPLKYRFPVNVMMTQFKYKHHFGFGRSLVNKLLEEIHKRYDKSDMPQLIVPMPMHPARQKQRGFNQAQWISEKLSRQLRIPYDHDLCLRLENNPSQSMLDKRARLKNLRNSFRLRTKAELSLPQHIAIVDDVITTGASVLSLATALDPLGKTKFDVWALARTPL